MRSENDAAVESFEFRTPRNFKKVIMIKYVKNETKNIGEALNKHKKKPKKRNFLRKTCCKDGDNRGKNRYTNQHISNRLHL